VAILSTPSGYTLAPMKKGKTLGPDQFEQLPEEEQQRIEQVIEDLKQKMKETVRQVPVWQRESRERFKELNREVTERTVDAFIRDLKQRYEDLPRVQAYLEAVKQDVVENVDVFRQQAEQQQQQSSVQQTPRRSQEFNRYLVNVLVDNDDQSGAPVLYEDNPVYQNLIGRIEHRAQMGALTTDFTLIKPGAVHRANGGYLILDVRQLLTRPFAWEGIKRVLSAREIRIQGPEQWYGLAGTVSLEPEPIPLDIKVLLTGDRILYYLLQQYDPEFNLLFKATADFAEDIDRSGENTDLYARMIASLQSQEGLRPFDRTGVARVIEHCARRADDAEKLSVHMGTLADLLRESDYWAGTDGSQVIGAEDVQRAIDAQVYRVDQLRERVHEAILRDTLMIATDGSEVAQVNGLSVVQLGDFIFGRPNRISATARLGEGKVIDIEREAELGGKIHSKGVMILSSYLAHRYEPERPLSLAASLVFEQSYAMVEGDSASAAELCALVSALSGVALKQAMAITGSVNQHGQIQPIGGVNEKVEGFFDVCRQRELTGGQGVIIPKANVKHLMLRRDVVEACEAQRFHVWPVDHVDQAISLLTGQAAGAPDAQGRFPQGTVNRRVRDRLLELSNLRLAFARESRGEGEGDG